MRAILSFGYISDIFRRIDQRLCAVVLRNCKVVHLPRNCEAGRVNAGPIIHRGRGTVRRWGVIEGGRREVRIDMFQGGIFAINCALKASFLVCLRETS